MLVLKIFVFMQKCIFHDKHRLLFCLRVCNSANRAAYAGRQTGIARAPQKHQNISKEALNEIETEITEYMMKEKRKYMASKDSK